MRPKLQNALRDGRMAVCFGKQRQEKIAQLSQQNGLTQYEFVRRAVDMYAEKIAQQNGQAVKVQ